MHFSFVVGFSPTLTPTFSPVSFLFWTSNTILYQLVPIVCFFVVPFLDIEPYDISNACTDGKPHAVSVIAVSTIVSKQ